MKVRSLFGSMFLTIPRAWPNQSSNLLVSSVFYWFQMCLRLKYIFWSFIKKGIYKNPFVSFTCLASPDTSEEYCTVELLSREVLTAIPETQLCPKHCYIWNTAIPETHLYFKYSYTLNTALSETQQFLKHSYIWKQLCLKHIFIWDTAIPETQLYLKHSYVWNTSLFETQLYLEHN